MKTDDSFQFARAVKRLRSAIEALGDVTGGGGSGSDQRDAEDTAEAAGAGQSLTLSLERKRAVIEIMKETIKSYHLAWARSSIEPAFKVRAPPQDWQKKHQLESALDSVEYSSSSICTYARALFVGKTFRRRCSWSRAK